MLGIRWNREIAMNQKWWMIIYFTEALRPKTCQEGIEKRAIYKYQNFEKNKVVRYLFLSKGEYWHFSDLSTTKR